MMTRFVMRNGDVFESSKDPRQFDAYCYRKDGVEETCIMLSDQSEIQFLMQMGYEAHLKYDAVELG